MLQDYLHLRPSSFHQWADIYFGRFHEKRGQKTAVLAPRGSAKTTKITKQTVLYDAVHGYERYQVLLADTVTQSVRNLVSIRTELERNPVLKRDYPYAFGEGPVWNDNKIVLRNGCCIEAMGRGSKVRGVTFGRYRPTKIVMDDIENDESVESDDQREKTLEWIQRTVLPAGDKNTNFVAIGTALHPHDYLQKIKKGEFPGWKFFSYKSLIKEPSDQKLWDRWRRAYNNYDDPDRLVNAREMYDSNKKQMDAGSSVLWEDGDPLYSLMCLREDIGELGFESEKQDKPAKPGQLEWPQSYFDDIRFRDFPALRVRLMSLDPSKGETEDADYSAFIWGGLGFDGCFYLDADFEIRDVSQIVQDGFDILHEQMDNRIDGWGTEINSFQSLLQTDIEREAKKRRLIVPTYGIKNTERKNVRIRRLTPWLRQRKMKIRKSKGGDMLIDQLSTFPTGRYKDGPDATEMLVRLARHLLNETKDTDEERVFAQ